MRSKFFYGLVALYLLNLAQAAAETTYPSANAPGFNAYPQATPPTEATPPWKEESQTPPPAAPIEETAKAPETPASPPPQAPPIIPRTTPSERVVPSEDLNTKNKAPDIVPTEMLSVPSSSVAETSLLNVGVRFDSQFIGGDPTQQGFSIPSARLTASGDATSYLSYRFSVGQTREFTSLSLPQLMPVEAYVQASNLPTGVVDSGSRVSLTMGLFTPSFNPWWTPDLTYLYIPDYAASHRMLFITRDIGAEITFAPLSDRVEFAIGAFNGNGIQSPNTNNARAFTGMARAAIPLGPVRWMLGAGAYQYSQSSRGSVNFRTQWTADLYTAFDYAPAGISLCGEVFLGEYEDSTRMLSPRGAAGMVTVGIVSWLKLFARYETLKSAPVTGLGVRHFQAGPLFEPTPYLKIWGLYETTDTGGGPESLGLIRVRLII